MAVPDYQTFMKPVLIALNNGQTWKMRDLYSHLATDFALSETDLAEMLPSGRQATYMNRIGWAKTYLLKAGALHSPQRGMIAITQRGRELLSMSDQVINTKMLYSFPEFAQFQGTVPITDPKHGLPNVYTPVLSPEEQLDALAEGLNKALTDDLLAQVQQLTPTQFERLVVQLLVAMGYGGSVRDAGAALGRSGDDGVDGVIKQDSLGLDKIYLQAKRWQKKQSIGSSDVRNFIGSLNIKKASKGVFITTSFFTSNAIETVKQTSNATIILIDGEALAALMIEHGVGVTSQSTHFVRRLDADFFEEI
jgi:restriction system protein